MRTNGSRVAVHAVVRIPKALDQRLTRLAERTGRSKAYYAKRALEIYIEDLEDTLVAQAALAENRERVSLEEVLAKHGLADRADARGRTPDRRPRKRRAATSPEVLAEAPKPDDPQTLGKPLAGPFGAFGATASASIA
jgi:RHH-type rel operon transcriptional repressor/antitoxin RelB